MKRHILVLGHYSLEVLDRAPKVRTYHMIEALARQAWVTVITGTRRQRSRSLRKARPILHQVEAIYLESGSSTATPSDLWFLYQAHRRGIPIAVFVRDAYQMFPDLYPPKGFRGRILAKLYRVTLALYARWASVIFVPTAGLGAVVPGKQHQALLPPGGYLTALRESSPVDNPVIIYVGAGGPHDGVSRLIGAFARVQMEMPQVELWLVMRAEETNGLVLGPRVTVWQASGPALRDLMQRAHVAVIPRIDTVYNRLAFPVKLMDYLSEGLPVVVTQDSEAAAFVESAGAGMGVDDSEEGLASGLVWILSHEQERVRMAEAARAVVRQNLWEHRASVVLKALNPDAPTER